ncbi:Glycosyltransferase involved in cell wall bisynthesis (RfaB) (PDB:2IV7) [Commensalibacter communis]|uniref:Glycosyltransferase involved in cell wall bisynthesis (RfaB) n=1 Tax=Commensalibacter communis TaxID=2972786 RepID=A0A9W4TQ70_9PROT|nr:hypothetical protein [Commensalibacter communis]CAI3949732.1 Glycosyltransferase involved in cell wall bisynthesis (RfaB) (PDB:2IV7) [Commensalibacter communis]CAI3950163.1 Glycosyltransferase involved in cell wall bisynthesis (RfaB) (PDB:2IV7) [Commensalibacter communis]CAI3951770.1 Glycosyltransferase involved in cell wall bisynthesis (RfaB) (PDB:2IV7) [Commensalibacter communis]CAI3951793.1 Glycosyltransferase involved in cell wall bisynthesis (RfaB) (PDB:2IV7) [Commensalibacter communis]
MSEGRDQGKQGQQQRVIDLNVNGHLMSLDAGLYCIYHAPQQAPADEFGFPGLRISLPPFKQSAYVSIETFENDGWLGAEKNAALIRISGGPGLILVTVYQNPSSQLPAPKLQVVRLNDAPEIVDLNKDAVVPVSTVKEHAKMAQQEQQTAVTQAKTESGNDISIFAHIQRMGDVTVKLGDWIGIPDSKTWIEGFGLNINKYIKPEDIEYQALLGKGWMSPWHQGNQFCGSRGMGLPLCGLGIKLSDEAAKKYHVRLSATFVDGTKVGPVEDETILSAESVAPLEAVRFELISIADGKPVGISTSVSVNSEIETATPKKIIRKIVPAKPVRSNIKLKTSTSKEAALKAMERKVTTKATSKKTK